MAWGRSCAAPSAIPRLSAWCMRRDVTGWICGACASSRSAWRPRPPSWSRCLEFHVQEDCRCMSHNVASSRLVTGRTLADLIRGTFVLLVVLAVGLLIGFRPEGMILNWVAALGLILLIDSLFIWFSELLGLVL